MDIGILNVVTYVPLVGALWILFFFDDPKNIRYGATFFAFVDFLLSLILWWRFDSNASGEAIFQFRWTRDWIQRARWERLCRALASTIAWARASTL